MKRLTKEEWEKLELKYELEEERIEKQCDKLAITQPITKRLKLTRRIFRK